MAYLRRRRAPARPRRRLARPAMAKPSVPRRRLARRARPVRSAGVLRVKGGGVTSSALTLPTTARSSGSKQAKVMKMIGSPNVLTLQESYYGIANQGSQDNSSWAHIPVTTLQVIRSQIQPLTVASNSLPTRYILESYSSEFLMTNSCSAPIEVDMWDVCVKKDLAASSTYTTGLGVYNLTGDPDSYWSTGALIAQGIAPGGGSGATYPSEYIGSTPYDSQLFRDHFTVKRHTVLSLPQGAVHRHVVNLKPNFVVTDAVVQQNTQGAIAGLTCFTLFSVKGFPTAGFVSPATDPPKAVSTTTQASLSVVQTRRYKYTWTPDFTNSVNVVYSLPIINPESILNVGSGDVADWADTVNP